MTDTTELTGRLASAFACVLREWATDSEWETMREVNRDYAQSEFYDGCCASHDFCDANMAMDAAFVRVLGRPAALECNEDGTEHPDFALWDAAWNIAKPLYLTAPEADPMDCPPRNSWGAHLDPLVAEYEAWTESRGLSGEGDALELLMGDLTPEQRAWLHDFIARWDVAQAAADAEYRASASYTGV